jgi:hypothetical protein
MADDVDDVLLDVFFEGHQTEQKDFFFPGLMCFLQPCWTAASNLSRRCTNVVAVVFVASDWLTD